MSICRVPADAQHQLILTMHISKQIYIYHFLFNMNTVSNIVTQFIEICLCYRNDVIYGPTTFSSMCSAQDNPPCLMPCKSGMKAVSILTAKHKAVTPL